MFNIHVPVQVYYYNYRIMILSVSNIMVKCFPKVFKCAPLQNMGACKSLAALDNLASAVIQSLATRLNG